MHSSSTKRILFTQTPDYSAHALWNLMRDARKQVKTTTLTRALRAGTATIGGVSNDARAARMACVTFLLCMRYALKQIRFR